MTQRRTARSSGKPADQFVQELRGVIAKRLGVDIELVRYGEVDSGVGVRGTTGQHWQVFWRGRFRELPWHYDGPEQVTWPMIRRLHRSRLQQRQSTSNQTTDRKPNNPSRPS